MPDDIEPLQKRMSFSATDMPSLVTINANTPSNNKTTINKIKDFGSRFSSMVTRQAAPTINKLTTQGFIYFVALHENKNFIYSIFQQNNCQ